MKKLEELTKEELLQEINYLQKVRQSLAERNTDLTMQIAHYEAQFQLAQESAQQQEAQNNQII